MFMVCQELQRGQDILIKSRVKNIVILENVLERTNKTQNCVHKNNGKLEYKDTEDEGDYYKRLS